MGGSPLGVEPAILASGVAAVAIKGGQEGWNYSLAPMALVAIPAPSRLAYTSETTTTNEVLTMRIQIYYEGKPDHCVYCHLLDDNGNFMEDWGSVADIDGERRGGFSPTKFKQGDGPQFYRRAFECARTAKISLARTRRAIDDVLHGRVDSVDLDGWFQGRCYDPAGNRVAVIRPLGSPGTNGIEAPGA